MDDYNVKSKVAFDVAYGGYKNEQEKINFIREMQIKQEVVETSVVVETRQPQPPPSSTPILKAEKKEYQPPKKRKAKR